MGSLAYTRLVSGRTVEYIVATTFSKGGSAGLDITGISVVESERDEAEGAR